MDTAHHLRFIASQLDTLHYIDIYQMEHEYPHCCLHSQMPNPDNADVSFDFDTKHSCDFYLGQALEALKKAQNHENWDKYSLKVYYDIDLNLEDAVIILQAAVAKN